MVASAAIAPTPGRLDGVVVRRSTGSARPRATTRRRCSASPRGRRSAWRSRSSCARSRSRWPSGSSGRARSSTCSRTRGRAASQWFPGLLLEALAAGGTDDVSVGRALTLVGALRRRGRDAAALVFARRDVTGEVDACAMLRQYGLIFFFYVRGDEDLIRFGRGGPRDRRQRRHPAAMGARRPHHLRAPRRAAARAPAARSTAHEGPRPGRRPDRRPQPLHRGGDSRSR